MVQAHPLLCGFRKLSMRFHYPQQQLDNCLSLVDLTHLFLSQINILWTIKTSMVLWGEEVEKADLG